MHVFDHREIRNDYPSNAKNRSNDPVINVANDGFNKHSDNRDKDANMIPQRKTSNINSNGFDKNKRPNVVINLNPERNVLMHNNYNNNVKRTYPGNSNYADITKRGNKLFIFSSSITKPINMIEFNKHFSTGHATKRAFGGATASQLKHYTQAALQEDFPDRAIISVGTNNLTKKNQTPQEIAEEIIDVVNTCRKGGVNDIFVSSITCRPDYQAEIDEINKFLEYYAGIYNYVYINNRCIREEHLKRDKLHLNNEGIRILSNNFLEHVNRPSLFSFTSIWD